MRIDFRITFCLGPENDLEIVHDQKYSRKHVAKIEKLLIVLLLERRGERSHILILCTNTNRKRPTYARLTVCV